MSSFNKVIIVGNLGRDPEVRYTAERKAVVTLSVATDAHWTDADGKPGERTDWHRVVVWGKQAELCGEHLKKGERVLVEGRLQNRDFEKDGQKHSRDEVVAQVVRFLGRGRAAGEAGGTPIDDLGADAPGADAAVPA